ncbi:hypothetical protein K474DRAFT_1658216 [Panus rudis PR-1116 ss-1]|nr:hypothetical protein K474DRAFT_1658216 [Panus rudis PR-1116 ss-1]
MCYVLRIPLSHLILFAFYAFAVQVYLPLLDFMLRSHYDESRLTMEPIVIRVSPRTASPSFLP